MAAVETGASVTEDVKPKRARRSRKASPVEEPVVEEAARRNRTAPQKLKLRRPPQTSQHRPPKTQSLSAPIESRTSPRRNPTVKSTRSDAAESEGDGKPKKAGWWQRRGFF